MSESDTILDLLARWDEERRQGRTPSPEQLCPGDARLRELLQQRITRRLRLQEALDLPDETRHEAVSTPAPALTIDGYTIGEQLGRGGMGVVYKARQQALQRSVALKVILSGASAGDDERARFRTEAEAVARLQHPNIVQIYEVGQQAGCDYLALEFVAGGSLAQHTLGRPLPPRRAAQLVLDLARAVEHAHAHGIVHRDLKPANILLTEDGTPKIADFGLAKRLDVDSSQTRTGAILGSPSYMAPEQAEGRVRAVGPATDVYALGTILYELLTGRPPFMGATFIETLEQVRHHDPAPPQTLNPAIPADLATICLKCLEKKPAQRYASAATLASDLQQFLQGEAIAARNVGLVDQVARLLRHSHVDVNFGAWSTLTLSLSPLPLCVHTAVFVLLRDRPEFPVVALAASAATVLIVLYAVLFGKRASYAFVPAGQRRQIWSAWFGHAVALMLTPLLVAVMIEPQTVEQWFIVYVFWLIQVGSTFYFLAANAGVLYLTGTGCYLLAILVVFIPTYAPLLVGLTMSMNMLTQGLFLRRLAQEAAAGNT